jgi:hypothetical protein
LKGSRNSLNDLGGLKKALQKAEREAAEEKARLAAEEARSNHERELFSRSVGPVQRLVVEARAAPSTPRPQPVPQQRKLDEEAVLKETISDDFTVDSLLETDETLSYRRDDIGLDVVTCTACAATKRASSCPGSCAKPSPAACVACGWCTARAWARSAASRC